MLNNNTQTGSNNLFINQSQPANNNLFIKGGNSTNLLNPVQPSTGGLFYNAYNQSSYNSNTSKYPFNPNCPVN
jgi:hypothetical protein